MARNKFREPLGKSDRKRIKAGSLRMTTDSRGMGNPCAFPHDSNMHRKKRRFTVVDTRVRSNNSTNWLHAVGFVGLVAIVISWALGY